MKNVIILVPESSVLAAIVDPRYMFTAVNEFLRSAGQQPKFNVLLMGLSKEVKLSEGLFSVHTDVTVDDAPKADLILIPALSGNLEQAIEKNKPFVSWINKQYKDGAEVASLCIGAFLLASTGLLNGKSCSTHWLFANQFRSMFPEVELMPDKIITRKKWSVFKRRSFELLEPVIASC
jgi:transcriptional regulator GlxA family with amidase domain